MVESPQNIIENFLKSDDGTLRVMHPDIRTIRPMLGLCAIDVISDIEISDFSIRLPMLLDYINTESEKKKKKGSFKLIKNDNDYFLKDERVEGCRLTRKDYKLGLCFLLKGFPFQEKFLMADILMDYLGKKSLTVDDWKKVDDEIFECFMISSNSLDRFVSSVPNLHKLSMVLKDTKDKFVVRGNGSIHISNWESVVEEFLDKFLSIRV